MEKTIWLFKVFGVILQTERFRSAKWAEKVCFHSAMARKGARKRTLILKYRMRFKYGLKAQKLLAQGSALGIMAVNKAPCKGKSFENCLILVKLLPLQGDKLASMITQGAALG